MSSTHSNTSTENFEKPDFINAQQSTEVQEHIARTGAFATFFEEIEEDSDDMSHHSQTNRQDSLYPEEQYLSAGFPQHNPTDVTTDPMYMNSRFGLSQSFYDESIPHIARKVGGFCNTFDAVSALPVFSRYGGKGCPSMVHRKPPKILVGRYLLGKTIGRGSYGKVKDSIDLVTLRRYAVKIVSRMGVRRIPGGWSQALVEAGILRALEPHRHIVSVAVVLRLMEPDRVVVVMEQCLGSVHDLQAAGVSTTVALSGAMDDAGGTVDTEEHLRPLPSSRGVAKCPGERFHRTLTVPQFHDPESADEGDFDAPTEVALRKQSAFQWSRTHKLEMRALGFQQFRRLPEAQAHSYFIQVIDGLAYLHSKGIIHRDIKPANLLITPAPGSGLEPLAALSHEFTDGVGTHLPGVVPFSPEEVLRLSRGYRIKLADFGVSVSVSAFTSDVQVGGGQITPAVQPPEVATGDRSTFDGPKLDVYCSGVSLFFMLTGRVPFSSPNVLQIFEAISEGVYVIPGHISSSAAHLIRGMMYKDPEKRFSLGDVARHDWICQTAHHPPPSLAVAAHACATHWTRRRRTDTATASPHDPLPSALPRGFPCWLDPILYLRRPTPHFEAPHIDDTGARIFSLPEIHAMCATGQIHLPTVYTSAPHTQPMFSVTASFCDDDDDENEEAKDRFCEAENPMDGGHHFLADRRVEPISVTEQLRMFHNWAPLEAAVGDEEANWHTFSGQTYLDESMMHLGLMDYGGEAEPFQLSTSADPANCSLQPFASTIPTLDPPRLHRQRTSTTQETTAFSGTGRRRMGSQERAPISPDDLPIALPAQDRTMPSASGEYADGSLTRRPPFSRSSFGPEQQAETSPSSRKVSLPPSWGLSNRGSLSSSRLTQWFSDSVSNLRSRLRTWAGSGTCGVGVAAMEGSFTRDDQLSSRHAKSSSARTSTVTVESTNEDGGLRHRRSALLRQVSRRSSWRWKSRNK